MPLRLQSPSFPLPSFSLPNPQTPMMQHVVNQGTAIIRNVILQHASRCLRREMQSLPQVGGGAGGEYERVLLS